MAPQMVKNIAHNSDYIKYTHTPPHDTTTQYLNEQ